MPASHCTDTVVQLQRTGRASSTSAVNCTEPNIILKSLITFRLKHPKNLCHSPELLTFSYIYLWFFSKCFCHKSALLQLPSQCSFDKLTFPLHTHMCTCFWKKKKKKCSFSLVAKISKRPNDFKDFNQPLAGSMCDIKGLDPTP